MDFYGFYSEVDDICGFLRVRFFTKTIFVGRIFRGGGLIRFSYGEVDIYGVLRGRF